MSYPGKWNTKTARRGNFTRVTRDPAVALSYDHIHKLSQEMDQGMRHIFAKHTIEYHQTQRMKKVI